MSTPRTLGRQAERTALDYLHRQGLRCLARNYQTRRGEIDLVMEDNASVVFVEVRSRATNRFGGALESVTAAKRQRLITAARCYLLSHPTRAPCRFDVVAIDGQGRIEWIRDAFQANA